MGRHTKDHQSRGDKPLPHQHHDNRPASKHQLKQGLKKIVEDLLEYKIQEEE